MHVLLIWSEDWKGIVFSEAVDGQPVESKPYVPENASKLLNQGDIGISIWLFIKEQAQKIQEEADKDKALILGKSSSSYKYQKARLNTVRKRSSQAAIFSSVIARQHMLEWPLYNIQLPF